MSFKDFFIKNILMSFFISVTCITAVMAVLGSVYDPGARFGYEALCWPFIFGVAASVPQLIQYSKKELSVKQQIARNVLHLILLEAVVLGIMYFGGALTDLLFAISLAVSVIIIYMVVSVVTWVNDKRIAAELNRLLKSFQQPGESQED